MQEELQSQNKPLVINIKNGLLYRYEGDDVFVNLKTGEKGIVKIETANQFFKIPLALNQLVLKYPNLSYLIETFKLPFQITDENGITKNYSFKDNSKVGKLVNDGNNSTIS